MATGKVLNNLIGGSLKAKYPAVQGSELSVNMYRGVNGGQSYMESLPGLRYARYLGGRCRGSYASSIGLAETHSQSDLFVVMGTSLYRIDAYGNPTRLGNVASGTGRVTFAETGGPRALLLVADGANLWYYDLLNGGELKAIQLPERVTERGGTITPSHVCVVEGTIAVNDSASGYVFYSAIAYPLSNEMRDMYVMDGDSPVYDEDGVTVKKESVPSDTVVFENDYHVPQFQNPYSSSDSIVALHACSNLLYVFSTHSLETWQRDNTENSGWIRVSYSVENSIGCEAAYSVANCSSILYFVGSGNAYGKGVFSCVNGQVRKISEDWLDEKLLSESTESAYGFCYAVGEHQFYVLQLNSLGETWVYDAMEKGEWHKRVSRDKNSGEEIQWRAGSVSYYLEKFYAFTNDGLVCRFHDNYWYEDFSENDKLPMIRHRQTAVITDNLRPFTFEELAVECNVGTWEDYELKPMLLLEVSKDGGNTFGNVRSASLGRTGNYSHRVRWLNMGLNRLCVIRLTYSHPTDLVLTYCSIRAEATAQMI